MIDIIFVKKDCESGDNSVWVRGWQKYNRSEGREGMEVGVEFHGIRFIGRSRGGNVKPLLNCFGQ